MASVAPDEFEAAAARVFTTTDGQVVLQGLIERFGFENRTTLVQGDPAFSAFHEGQRTVVVRLKEAVRRGYAGAQQQKEALT